MSTNLIDEIASRAAKRQRDECGMLSHPDGLPGIRREVAPVVADVLDILTAEGRLAPAIEPGVCWHDSGVTWHGETATTRCELRAGHTGAHECVRPWGGTATWLETTVAAETQP